MHGMILIPPLHEGAALIIGTGNAGIAAIEQAIAMNVPFTVCATSDTCRELVENRGGTFIKLPRDVSELGEVGQWVEKTGTKLPDSDRLLRAQQIIIEDVIENLQPDLILTTARKREGKNISAPCLVTAEAVESLRGPTVAVDLAASIGTGNIAPPYNAILNETSVHRGGLFVVENKSNYPSQFPDAASRAISTCHVHLVNELSSHRTVGEGERWNIKTLQEDSRFSGPIVIAEGELLIDVPVASKGGENRVPELLRAAANLNRTKVKLSEARAEIGQVVEREFPDISADVRGQLYQAVLDAGQDTMRLSIFGDPKGEKMAAELGLSDDQANVFLKLRADYRNTAREYQVGISAYRFQSGTWDDEPVPPYKTSPILGRG